MEMTFVQALVSVLVIFAICGMFSSIIHYNDLNDNSIA